MFYLFYWRIIKVDPFMYFWVEKESRVMFAIIADNSHKL